MKEKKVFDILMETLGEQEIKKIWEKHGMYSCARILGEQLQLWVQGYHIAYLADKFQWKRTVSDRSLPIYKSVISGQVPRDHFKHIIFL